MFSYINYGKFTKYFYGLEFVPGEVVHDVPGRINDPELIRVFDNVEAEAKHKVVMEIGFRITFKNWDNSTLSSRYYAVGTVLNPPDPVRPPDEHYVYTFAGWSPELAPVTADATYTAIYTASSREYIYTFSAPVIRLFQAPYEFEDATITVV